jgi:ABC-type antimicrobial peptide transport system permease subunit
VNLAVLKDQVWSLDPLQSIYNTETLDRLIGKTLAERRFNLFVIAGFALAALLLATAGVYGVISFSTSQRTREFGVRMALGAARRDIIRLVLREGLTLAGLGLAIGIFAALPAAQLWRSLLFGVSATDPLTLAAASLALLFVSTAACYLPAKRALDVDPVRSLRFE